MNPYTSAQHKTTPDCFSGFEWQLAKDGIEKKDRQRWTCLENFLTCYADITKAEKIPQDKLDSLFNTTRQLISVLYKREEWLGMPPEKLTDVGRRLQMEFQVVQSDVGNAKTRLDKLLAIERFVHLTHVGGVLLPRACDLSGIGYDLAVQEVLDCLLEGKHKGETIRRDAKAFDALSSKTLPQGKSVVGRFSVQEVIDSIQKAIDEADKTASVKRIERVLDGSEVERFIEGADDLREAIADYKGIERVGLTPEDYQEEKETAFEAIQEAVDGLDIDEDALESLEAPPVKTRREQIMEFDYAHTLEDLKKMAREKGVSPSGTKHEIIDRLI